MSIGVGIVGGGIFAREQHLPAVEAAKHLTLKTVYSRSLKSAQSLQTDSSKVDLYSDDSGDGKGYKDLLSRDDIHAVIIALPILNQPEYIKAALSAGKHVLSEKPVAENTKDAQELIKWYQANIDSSKVTWGIAENLRFSNSFDYASGIAQKLGKVLSFRMRMNTMLKGGKYYETEWRKTPSHQGGFVLDAGVHFIAALRQLLGSDTVATVSAFTTQNQKHLPPLDTLDACLKTKTGGTGTVSISFGTTLSGSEYTVGFEGGSVSVVPGTLQKMVHGKEQRADVGTVTTLIDGKEETKQIEDEGTGVVPEIRAWGEALVAGKPNPKQSPEEALADLEMLENMFKSGDAGGAPQPCKLQI
ncbi:hypothetical protein MMC10_009731 [Thelotrema lepadinum]|nr:hypothetical protein [Thelotrema lepadinum]